MTFNYVKLPELQFELKSETTEKGRLYFTPEGNAYPSITTVLSEYNRKAIFQWRQRVGEEEANRISKKASGRGTKLHNTIEKYLLNEMSELQAKMIMPDLKEMFYSLKPFLDSHVNNIYGIEQPLYSDALKIAGRCDCIGEWNGELSIIDWKTASRSKDADHIQNYFMQATAYAEMFEERTNLKVNQIVIAIAVEADKPQIFIRNKHEFLSNLQNYIDRHHSAVLA